MLNRAITDLKVKQLLVEWRSGNTWGQSGLPVFRTDMDYRLSVTFGNTAGRIEWDRDLYDKENIRVVLIPFGIYTSSGYIHGDGLRYFDDESFASPARRSPSQIEIIGPFKTVHADILSYQYFRSRNAINDYPLTRFRFVATISAAIRNERSHQVIVEV